MSSGGIGRLRRVEDLGRRRAIKHMHERLRRLTDEQLVALWFPGGRLDGGPLRDGEELWRILRELGITKELVELAVAYRPGMPAELVEVRMDAAFAPLNELGRARSSAISDLARRMREEERQRQGTSTGQAREPGVSIAEILADPEARAFIASPVPMAPKPNEYEEGGR